MRKELTFAIGDLLPIVVTLAVAGLVTAFALQVMGDVHDDMDTDSYEQNATQDAIEGISKVPEKFGIIATVSVAAVIIGLLLTYFLGRISR